MHNKHTKRENASGIVYSTNPDFVFNTGKQEEPITLPPQQQNLIIKTDSKNRKGKIVTLIDGFIGKIQDLRDLEKKLKIFCGTGGSVKNGIIIIQGEFKEKLSNYLISEGYKVRRN